MKKLAGLFLVMMGIFVFAVSAGFNVLGWINPIESKAQQQSIAYEEAETIEFDVNSQDITITRHDKDTVDIQSSGQDNIDVSTTNDNVVIRQDKTSWLSLLFFETGSEWEVKIPASFSGDLKANGGSSDINVDNGNETIRSLQMTVASGDVDIRHMAVDDLELSAKSGDFSITNVSSNQSSVETISGDMEIDQFKGPLTATLTSGGIDVTFEKFEESTIEVTSGDVDVSVGDADIRLDCSVVSGDISNELTLDSVEQTQRHLSGVKGSGSDDLIIETVSGDINIR
ncbi:lia operon protein LiaG [Salibacterium salarium]|uniref:DUF4097 family beta strand repeat-containing protein n=1 Tax=Salibacterium salarium TaxID=284579 RepID=UPI0027831761|nr:DUF4097 family beta strand repeat-containing protein [Salibacterium salarium]MDQ0298357.1 lia operon protein LiaG [Salibacterium salarium]